MTYSMKNQQKKLILNSKKVQLLLGFAFVLNHLMLSKEETKNKIKYFPMRLSIPCKNNFVLPIKRIFGCIFCFSDT